MSLEALSKFGEFLAGDAAAMEAIAKEVADQSEDERRTTLVRLAGDRGFVVTVEDVAEAESLVPHEGDLSDDDLNAVNGGLFEAKWAVFGLQKLFVLTANKILGH